MQGSFNCEVSLSGLRVELQLLVVLAEVGRSLVGVEVFFDLLGLFYFILYSLQLLLQPFLLAHSFVQFLDRLVEVLLVH